MKRSGPRISSPARSTAGPMSRILLTSLPGSAAASWSAGPPAISIIRRSEDGARSASLFSWSIEPGRGRMIATYAGHEGTPLPSFTGEPVEVNTGEAAAKEMAEAVYDALTPQDSVKDYRVAVACISALRSNLRNYDVHIINRREG